MLNEIKEIQRVIATDLSQEELILNELEFILGKDWPPIFPRFIKDPSGRFINPAQQLTAHRDYLVRAISPIGFDDTADRLGRLSIFSAKSDTAINPIEYAKLTTLAADKLFLICIGNHLGLNSAKKIDPDLSYDVWGVELHIEAEKGRQWLQKNTPDANTLERFRGQFIPPEIGKCSHLTAIEAQSLASPPHPAVYQLKNLETLKTNVPWRFEEFPKLKELTLDVQAPQWEADMLTSLNDLPHLEKVTVNPSAIPLLVQVITENSNIRTLKIENMDAAPPDVYHFTSGDELVKFLHGTIPKQKMG